MENNETDTKAPVKQEIIPSGWRKEDQPDYKNGPVRIYTGEEIAQYMMHKRGFCHACGASVPHRHGEGRCQHCMCFLPEDGT